MQVLKPTPIWKHILWAAIAILLLYSIAQIPTTLKIFVMAWLIAYLLNPAVEALEGQRLGPIKKCSRAIAVALITTLLVGILVAVASLMVPNLTEQLQRLVNLQSMISDPSELPQAINEKIEPLLAKLPAEYRDEIMERATTFIQESASTIGSWATLVIVWLGNALADLVTGITIVATAFLVSIYMLMTWKSMGQGILEKLPRRYREEILSLSNKMQVIFGGYLKATILTSIACCIATFLSMLVLNLVTGVDFPYKYIISVVAGLLYPIPFIGIIATSILGGVLGYVAEESLAFGLAVLITINVVNMIIDRTVQPALMSNAMGVSELFVMFAAFAGGEVAGIWGMLLGIPVAAMGKTLFEWFHLNFLQEPESAEAGSSDFDSPPTLEPVPPPAPAESVSPPTPEPKPAESAAPGEPVPPSAPAESVSPPTPKPEPVESAAPAEPVPPPAPAESVSPPTPEPEPVESAAPAEPVPPPAPEPEASEPPEAPPSKPKKATRKKKPKKRGG